MKQSIYIVVNFMAIFFPLLKLYLSWYGGHVLIVTSLVRGCMEFQ